jgi:LemA protein
VLAVAEAYPDLKASPVYARLHDALVDAEDRIAFAREFHNATITALTNRCETMPDALVARLTGLKPGTWFAASGFERASVRVSS